MTPDLLIEELTREAEPTRRVLERVSEDQFSWKPHPKSMSLGQLALHIATLPRGIATLLADLERGPPIVPLTEASGVEQLLTTLDDSVAFAINSIEEWGEEGLAAQWRMVIDGQVVFANPRSKVLRSLLLNHWYHHRGQLTVYLRLLDVPLPSIYGPTADEPW